jgi:hypothetical protein
MGRCNGDFPLTKSILSGYTSHKFFRSKDLLAIEGGAVRGQVDNDRAGAASARVDRASQMVAGIGVYPSMRYTLLITDRRSFHEYS